MKTDNKKLQWKRPFYLEQNKRDYTDTITNIFSHDRTTINAVGNFVLMQTNYRPNS